MKGDIFSSVSALKNDCRFVSTFCFPITLFILSSQIYENTTSHAARKKERNEDGEKTSKGRICCGRDRIRTSDENDE